VKKDGSAFGFVLATTRPKRSRRLSKKLRIEKLKIGSDPQHDFFA